MITLTKSERQIMEIIWHADHPMAQGEVVAACKWISRSIFSMLNSLMEKGLLKATGYERSGKTYARTFEAAMSQAEYFAFLIKDAALPPEQFSELIELLKV